MSRKQLNQEYSEFMQGQQIQKLAKKTFKRVYAKVGRNQPCPCTSGKKYKNCCLNLKK